MLGLAKTKILPDADSALPDREQEMPVTNRHFVHGRPIKSPFPEHLQTAVFGMGCFWGAERIFWQTEGVYSTAVGYAGGTTRNATYRDACSGLSGHTEAVLVIYHPQQISYQNLLTIFWQSHDPTQGMRQGNDHGTQYRSAIYTYSEEQHSQALASKSEYQKNLSASGYSMITTEIQPAPAFFYAEDDHQQYLAKNPRGYCGIGGTGVSCESL